MGGPLRLKYKVLIISGSILALVFLSIWTRDIIERPVNSNDEEIKITMKHREKVTSYLDSLIKNGETPGLQYVVVNANEVLFTYQSGYSDISENMKVTEKTTFNGFSVTKTFTALAILQLAEENKLSIDDPVSKYIINNPYGEKVTIRQLLTHTAGLPNPIPLKWIHLIEEDENFNYNQFISTVLDKNSKLKNPPGVKFGYSNLGYLLLGQIVESVSGISYKDYIRTNILDSIPIDSDDLSFEIISENKHAKGYQKTFSFMNFLLGFFIDKDKYMSGREGKWTSFKSLYVNGSAYGGLIGNAIGFSKYLQQLLKEDSDLISSEYKMIMFSKQKLNDGKEINMGLGWFHGTIHGKNYFTHPGGGGGYYSEIRIYPENNLATVVMFNRSGMSDERILDNVDRYLME